jgi:hypothetical protein
MVGDVLGRQLLRSGTSPGAQHREACRARSTAEFVSKLESAVQELDETAYWLELIADSGIVNPKLLCDIQRETDKHFDDGRLRADGKGPAMSGKFIAHHTALITCDYADFLLQRP